MKIAVINRQGLGGGGATRAARRLMMGLRARGHRVLMVSAGPGLDPEGIGIEAAGRGDARGQLALRANPLLQSGYIAPRRTALSNTLFSSEVAGYDLAATGVLAAFDVLNLHWVPGFLAPHNVEALVGLGKPVVLTLHDMAALTGGCHYSAGCQGYRAVCNPCAQLAPDALELAAWTQREKRRVLRHPRVVAVAPSRWLADCAEAAGVFGEGQVHVIPNGLDTEVFRPTDKAVAKRGLGLPPGAKTLLFGAETGQEHRKGFDLLLQMLRRMRDDPRISALLAAERLRVLAFGHGSEALHEAGIPVDRLGVIAHDAHLSLVYSAADLAVLPSREDNLPNILLEAMACGTPVAAFAVGGATEVIETRRDGVLIPAADVVALADAVSEVLSCDTAAQDMGTAARAKVVERYALAVQAAAYEALFETQLTSTSTAPRRTPDAAAVAPGVVAAPVTLNPGLAGAPLELWMEQAARCADSEAELVAVRHRLRRAEDVLRQAYREACSSTFWRATRWLRRGQPGPRAADGQSAEALAIALLTLFRSKSWEATGWLRTLVRLGRLGRRTLRFGRGTATALALPLTTKAPADSGDGPLRLVLPPPSGARIASSEAPELNVICLHLFHVDLWDEFQRALRPVIAEHTPLYLSVPEAHADFLAQVSQQFRPHELVGLVVDNRGLDVLPFLRQFRSLRDGGRRPRTLTKLHSKKSAHIARAMADRWRHELCDDLIRHHAAICREFRRHPRLGMACSSRWWLAEESDNPNFQAECRVIAEACAVFDVPRSTHYLSGSMYTLSFEYLERLFAGVDLEAYFATFPAGYRPSDTPAHAFERIVCYGLQPNGYQVGLIE